MVRILRNEQYSLLAVISELSTVRCDRVLGLWLQVNGRRVSTERCRGGAQAGRQLWRPLLDRGRKQRRMAGFLVCATKPSWRTAVEDAKSWRHGRRSWDWRRNGRRRRLGPHCGRGGDGRRVVSRAIRRPRWKRRLGPRRLGGNLPAHGVLAVFSKLASYPGFADPPKLRTGSSSTWWHRGEGFESKKETPPLDEIMYIFPVLPLRAF